MNAFERQPQQINPREVFGSDADSPERFYSIVMQSFGDGVGGGRVLLNYDVVGAALVKGEKIGSKQLAEVCLREMAENVFPYLNNKQGYKYQVLENLLTTKFEVELAEIKRMLITRDLLGKRAEMVWRERQVQEVRPEVDAHADLVAKVEEVADPDELQSRVLQYEAVMEEWAMALEHHNLALSELQLQPGESVEERLKKLLMSKAPENDYDRANGSL